VPLISGKDSMKNDYMIGDTKISIPPTVLFSVIGRIDDVRTACTMDVKRPGDRVYLLGITRDECGGSEYYSLCGQLGANVPQVDAATALARYRALNRAQRQGLVASCHDLSDGGLGVALAEKAFAGGCGIHAELGRVPVDAAFRDDRLLFSESASRLLVTVRPDQAAAFEALFAGQACACIGEVTAEPELRILGLNGEILIKSSLAGLKESWQEPLREM